jgi:preprotein translocase subunit SecA
MNLNKILSRLFGNKSKRDLKEIDPYVQKILSIYPVVKSYSNDKLRERTQELMTFIQNKIKTKKQTINELKSSVESLKLVDRGKVWANINKIEKDIIDKQEETLDEILPEVFAIVKDTARRFAENETLEVTATDFDHQLAVSHNFVSIKNNKAVYSNHWIAGGIKITWDMVHYDVQLFGGIVLHNYNKKKYIKETDDHKISKKIKGYIAEMATGEGKTLAATLPIFLNAMTHNGVHVVTVNDYLSKRDSEWMGPLYMFHGLSVDCIDKHTPNSNERRKAYEADITFGTNNEFGFDYLRDNMATNPHDLVQRSHNYAIIDEVDSVLIDDARTPLIISGPVHKIEDQLYSSYCQRVENLVNIQKKLTSNLLTEAKKLIKSGNSKQREKGLKLLFRSYKGMPKNKALIKYLSEPGIKASMLKTEEFYMQQQNREMHIITDELYFIIDEKNKSIELTDKGIDILTGNSNDLDFFILPDLGTKFAKIENEPLSKEEKQSKKDELMQNYSVKSERVHTINQLLKAYCLFEKNYEYIVLDNKVLIVDEQTGRIMEGRRYSDGLHQAIEAKEHVKVREATQTFATITLQNYFRMYRKLAGMTGTAETEAGEFWDIYKLDIVVIPTNKPIVRNDKDDKLYKTVREKYTAIIKEIITYREQGRPVLVGTTSVEISEVLSRMLDMYKIHHNVLNAKLHQKEAEIIAQAGQTNTVTIATNMAGRGTDIKLSLEAKKAGGLAIIGTERHESRRIDRQLRGRSGRQGDPGSSIFFISLEDDLMRLFASDRIVRIMDKIGFKEGEVLEAKLLNNAVERAQKKIEENNFGIRKRLLEYDDVMNSQREIIYTRRYHALIGERIAEYISNIIYDTVSHIIECYSNSNSYKNLKSDLQKILTIELPVNEDEFKRTKILDLIEIIFNSATENFKRKNERMVQNVQPIIERFYKETHNKYQNIVIPITDGERIYNISCHLETAYNTKSKNIIKSFEKTILLYSIDEAWKEHLREIDELRHSVQNASYENKDPLLVYKLEAFNLFKKMIDTTNKKTVSILMRGQVYIQNQEVNKSSIEIKTNYNSLKTIKDKLIKNKQTEIETTKNTNIQQKTEQFHSEKTIRRNDICPCGSNKKYKKCCGKL